MLSRIGQLQTILANGQAAKIEGYLMDSFTASMLVSLYNALGPENQDRFDSIPLSKLVDFGWKQVAKSK